MTVFPKTLTLNWPMILLLMMMMSSYKDTRVFDPMKSETYRAIQEDNMGYRDHRAHEVPQPVQTKVFQPHQMVRINYFSSISDPSNP